MQKSNNFKIYKDLKLGNHLNKQKSTWGKKYEMAAHTKV